MEIGENAKHECSTSKRRRYVHGHGPTTMMRAKIPKTHTKRNNKYQHKKYKIGNNPLSIIFIK
jgi:hypothetical protein